MRALVFVSATVGYMFGINGDNDLDYMKTTNGGATWAAAGDVRTGTVEAFDVWYDQWTPGNTGRDIHIFFIDGGTTDLVLYFRFNTVDDTKTSAITVSSTNSTVAGRGQFVSGTRARGGNLYCAYDIDAGAEVGFFRSLDNGATWATRGGTVVEATLDQAMLFPANAADPQDIWMLYDDDSAAELTIKTYDDSANTTSESAALSYNNQATDAVGQYGFAGSIRHLDGFLLFAFMSTYDAASGATTNFKVYTWDGTTATALTDIATGKDDIYYPGVYLNQDQPDWIYVAYLGVSGGTSTLTTSMPVLYALSKDRGATWTKDIAYSTSTTDYRQCWVPLNGEKFMVVFTDISALSLNTNDDNSIGFGFTTFNNYLRPRATGQDNTGIIQTSGMG